MAKFTSDKEIRFYGESLDGKEYETNDQAEIEALREHPDAREIHERSAHLSVKVSGSEDGHYR